MLLSSVASITHRQVAKLQACSGVSVWSVTVCAGRIYVLCTQSNVLKVFDSATYTALPSITVPVLTANGAGSYSVRDIVCATDSNTLYLAEMDPGVTHRIWKTAAPAAATWTLWKDSVASVMTMSVTGDGKILIPSRDDSKLLKFNQDGSLVASVPLSTATFPLHSLFHAVQLTPERYCNQRNEPRTFVSL